ncbi:hypothetical protein BC830DRAFT_316425 [Chytriomyces sp. MP71]|nr:hypothetical protein BC830DRAFT_316425 [Chytriomyces sp. MP71]
MDGASVSTYSSTTPMGTPVPLGMEMQLAHVVSNASDGGDMNLVLLAAQMMNKKKDKLSADLESSRNENEELKGLTQRLQSNLNSLVSQQESLKTMIDAAQREAKQAEAAAADFERYKSNIAFRSNNLENSRRAIEAELTDLRNHKEKSISEKEQCTTSIKELEEAVATARATISSHETKIIMFEGLYQESTAKLQDTTSCLSEAQAKCISIETEYRERVSAMSKDAERLQVALEELKAAHDSLLDKHTALAETHAAALRDAEARHVAQMNLLETKHVAAVESLRLELRDEKTGGRTEVVRVREEIETRIEKMECAHRERVQGLENALTAERMEVKQRLDEIRGVELEVSKRDVALASLKGERDVAVEAVECLKQENGRLQQSVGELSVELRELRGLSATRDAEIAEVRKASHASNQIITEQLNQVIQDRDAIMNEFGNCKTALSNLRGASEARDLEFEELKKQLADATMATEQVNGAQAEAKTLLDSKSEEIEKLRSVVALKEQIVSIFFRTLNRDIGSRYFSQIATSEAQATVLTVESLSQAHKIEELEAAIQEAKKNVIVTCRESEQLVARLEGDLQLTRSELSQMDMQWNECKVKYFTVLDANKCIEKEFGEAKAKIVDLESAYQVSSSNCKKYVESLAERDQSLTELKMVHESKLLELEAKLDQAQENAMGAASTEKVSSAREESMQLALKECNKKLDSLSTENVTCNQAQIAVNEFSRRTYKQNILKWSPHCRRRFKATRRQQSNSKLRSNTEHKQKWRQPRTKTSSKNRKR